MQQVGAAAARCHAEGAAVRKAPHGDASPAPAGIFAGNGSERKVLT